MAMGTTSKVKIDGEMQAAKQACTEYRTKISSLLTQLDSTVNGLLQSDFTGEAATAFQNFYKTNVFDFFSGENCTFDKYLSMFDKQDDGLFDSIEKALIKDGGLDPSLAENNNSIGQSSTGEGQTAN